MRKKASSGNGIQYTAKQLKDASPKEMLLLLTADRWSKMTPESRLLALQEMENRQAKRDGRPAAILLPRDLGNASGVHQQTAGADVILINERFLMDGVTGVWNAAAAVSTVLHEGRHAFQKYCVQTDSAAVGPEQLREWMVSSFGVYMDPKGDAFTHMLYEMQAIEADARRFSRRAVAGMLEAYRRMGAEAAEYALQAEKARAREINLIRWIRDMLTLKTLDAMERSFLDYFRCRYPMAELEGVTLFDYARLVLRHPEIEDMDRLLEMIDRKADEKLALREGDRIAFAEPADRKRAGDRVGSGERKI